METAMTSVIPKRKGLPGSTLKMIAIITMLIDHVGAALVGRLLIVNGYTEAVNTGNMQTVIQWMQDNALLYYGYSVMRMIGRIAFPIFIFLMIEGFEKTSNRWKYAIRLGAFALISEIPFDLAFNAKILEFTYQNVFFTLLIGFLTMWGIEKIEEQSRDLETQWCLQVLLVMAAGFLAEKISCDYGAYGIIAIGLFYLFRRNRPLQIFLGCGSFCWEWPACFACIPLSFYNGKRGLNLKYVFYAFYPVHLLVLFLIRRYCF